jgi:DNA invertase Pin-like site-specific DNA recombinase
MKRKQTRTADQPRRVAGYVRVSTARQAAEGDSLVAQENAIRAKGH